MPTQRAHPKKAGRRAHALPLPAVLDETPRHGSASFCGKCSRLFEVDPQAGSDKMLCPSCIKRRTVRAKAAKLSAQTQPQTPFGVPRSKAINLAAHTGSDRSVELSAPEKNTLFSLSRTPFQADRDVEPQLALRMGMEDVLLDHSPEGQVAAEADEPAFAAATASLLLHLRRENRTLRRRLAAHTHAVFSAPRSGAETSLAIDPEEAFEPGGVRELRQRLNDLLRQPPRSSRAEEKLWKVGVAVNAVSEGWGGSRRREARWRGAALVEQSASAVVLQELNLLEEMLSSLHAALGWSGEQLAVARAEARELRQKEQQCQVRMLAAEAARSEAQLQADVRHDAWLQLRDELDRLQSTQGYHHTQLIDFVNTNHGRLSEELRGRDRRFRRLEQAVLAALAAAGHAAPLPPGKPSHTSLHELAAAVGEGAEQVRESLTLLATEVGRGEALQRDAYERRLRKAEAELLRVTRTRQDFIGVAQRAAQHGTEQLVKRLAVQLEQLGAAQDVAVGRLAEQSRHEKARLGAMRAAFSDELEQACARHAHVLVHPWCTRGLCMVPLLPAPVAPLHSHLHPHASHPAVACGRCTSYSTHSRPSMAAPSRCGQWTSSPTRAVRASTSRRASRRQRWLATTPACSPGAGPRGARSCGATAPRAPRGTRRTKHGRRAPG